MAWDQEAAINPAQGCLLHGWKLPRMQGHLSQHPTQLLGSARPCFPREASPEKRRCPCSPLQDCKGSVIWKSFLTSHYTLCTPHQMLPHTCIIPKTGRGSDFLILRGRDPQDTQ